MARSGIIPAGAGHALGSALRRWRLLNRVKQVYAAQLLGVAQSTVSRWEDGCIIPNPAEARRIEALVAARLDNAADAMLARLVSESPRAMHLICDRTHRLLACSASRAAAFRVPADALLGTSLWGYATEQVAGQESDLPARGWYDLAAPPPVEFDTGANGRALVPIRPSRCRWTRMMLSDGAPVRLVETLASVQPVDQRG